MAVLPNLSPETVDAYKAEIAKTASPATAKRKAISLNRFFGWAEAQGHIPQNPMSPNAPRTNVNPFVIQAPKKGKVPVKTLAFTGITVGMVVLIFLLLQRLKVPIPFITNFAQESKIQTTSTGQISPVPSGSPSAVPANSAVIAGWNLFTKLKLTSVDGNPQVGTQTLSFKIYDSPTGGTALYSSQPESITTDSSGSALISLDAIPTDLFFQNEKLYLEPDIGSQGASSQRILIPTANVASNLNEYPAANPETGAEPLTIPVLDSTGSLVLAGESPAVKATAGNLLVEGQTVTVKTADGSGGNIEINPDANGYAHFLFEGSNGNFLNAQAPNLTKGSLYYGMVPNNATGYYLLKLQSGSPKMTTRYSVDAVGNTNQTGSLSTLGVTRLTSGGALENITGYSQTSGNFTINQGAGNFASITKTLTSGGALSDVLTLTLDERGKPLTSNSDYSTLVLNRYDGNGAGTALLVKNGNAQFNGQVRLGNLASSPTAMGSGSVFYNTSDNLIYYFNGTIWQALGTAVTTPFNFISTGTNTTAAMTVGTGASLTFSGTGTITASDLVCTGCVSNSELVNSSITINSAGILTGGGAVSLGGTLNLTATEADTLDSVTTRGPTTANAITVGNLTDSGLTANKGVFTDGLKQLTSTGTLGADQGGTGFSSYTVGDLLYADTVSTLARLNDVAVGNALISGGVGVAPSWGKIVLGTHTTGNYVSTITGTANQITASSATGDVTLSIPSDFRAPGTVNAVNGLYTGAIAGTQRIDATGNLTNIGTTQLNGVTYTWPAAATANFILQSGSTGATSTLSWVDPNTVAASTIYWDQALGALFPKSNTIDVLIGSNATATAKFAFQNILTGTPTLNVSAQATNIAIKDATANSLQILEGVNPYLAINTSNGTESMLFGNGTTNPAYTFQGTGNMSFGGTTITASALTTLTTSASLSMGSTTSLTLGGSASILTSSGNLTLQPAGAGTTANVQIGAGGAGSATPDLLVLDAKNLTGDPAGTNGAMYYNVADGKMRCYQAGAWADCGSGAGGSSNWTLDTVNGVLYPISQTVDVLIGSTATTTAEFAFQNILTGTPTLNVSAQATNIAIRDNTTNALQIIEGASNPYLAINTNNTTESMFFGNANTNPGYSFLGSGSVTVTSGNVITTSATANLFNTNAATLSIGGASTTALNIGNGNSAYTAINIGSGTGGNTINIAGAGATGADTVNIGTGGTNADTINIGNSASTTSINYTSGTGSQTFTSSVATGTNTSGAFVFKDFALSSGDLIYATSSGSLTSGNLIKLGTGGDTTFTGNAIYADLDNTGQGGLGFTGNFLKFDNATLTKFTVDSSGNTVMAGNLNVNGGSILTASGNLTLQPAGAGTTANVQIGAGGAGSATPDLLVLDAKNLTGDPAGTNGAMYYNVADGKMRCYQAGAWADCGSGAGGSSNWTLDTVNGVLYPNSNTVDVLLGGSATTSADFAFIGIDGGLPTASIAGNIANVATYLTGNGVLSTTNAQDLTLGSTYTGNVIINSRGTTALTANLADITIAGNLAVNGGNITTTQAALNIAVANTGIISFTDGTNNLVQIADQGTTARVGIGGSLQVGCDLATAGCTSAGFLGYNRFVTANTVTTAHGLSTANDVLIGGILELDGIFYLDNGTIANSAGTATILFSATPTTTANSLSAGSWFVENTANVGLAALIVNQAKAGDLFTASSGGTTKFIIDNSGNVTINGSGTMLTVGGGTGKIDVGTVDPVYNIGGTKYATYMAGMVGVKEETTGSVQTSEYIPGVGYRHLIDFRDAQSGSDLWLFSKTTNLKDNMDKMVVLLSPSANTRAWYDIDTQNYILSVYTARPSSVSYRLTAPRFDYADWSNYNNNPDSTGFIIPDENLAGGPNGSASGSGAQSLADLSITQASDSARFDLQDALGNIIYELGTFSDLLAANIRAGAIQTFELITDTLTVETKIISPIAEIDTVKTRLISPLPDLKDITVQIGNNSDASIPGQLTIQDASGSAVASIDSTGNATFSGTLYAGKIQSTTLDDISSLLHQVQLDQDLLSQAATWSTNTASSSGTLAAANIGNLFVTNQAAINSLSVSTSLTVGTDLVIQSSGINTLSGPLQLQSLAMAPVEIMAGKFKIDTNGDVTIQGDLYVAGVVQSTGLNIVPTGSSLPTSIPPTASINASGSAMFNSVSADKFILAAQAATQSADITGSISTNASIGQTIIKAGVPEITIRNPSISDYTLVYITPTSSTLNNVLYVKSKGNGYFTVGFTNPINEDVTFNWWLIDTEQ